MMDERLSSLVRLFDASPDAALEDPDGEVARYLGLDLTHRLRAVAGTGPRSSPELLVEGARVCGDLATLIACNPALLSTDEALEATREAAAATRELLAQMEETSSEGERARYLIRDVRGAVWRADLAVRQMENTREDAAPDA